MELDCSEFEITRTEMEASNSKIKSYVLENFGLKVSSADIAQIKRKCGIETRKNYYLSKRDSYKTPICTEDKEKAIKEAMKYYKMI